FDKLGTIGNPTAYEDPHPERTRDPSTGSGRSEEGRMKILIQNGRVIDPASGRDEVADIAIGAGRIVAIGRVAGDFHASRKIDATGLIVAPGLVDLAVRLREPGHEHEGMLESEMAAAVAGGVTSLVCPPDTDPVLDEPGRVDMLKLPAEKLQQARVFPRGPLS